MVGSIDPRCETLRGTHWPVKVDGVLRSLLVAGATAVIQQVRRGRGRPSAWLLALLKRKPPKLAAVALANKVARIAWKLMTTGESYDGARTYATLLRAA